MYIERKLISSINEEYFRNHQDKKLPGFPLKESSSFIDLEKILNILETYEEFNNSEFYFQILDLNLLWKFEAIYLLNSTLSKSLRTKILDFSSKVENKTKELSKTAKESMNILLNLSKRSYIVGGFIRDSLLGIKNKDLDFVTDAPISEVQKSFEDKGWKVQNVGIQFLVCVVSKDDEQFEISNFRKDKDNSGGIIGTIFEDAQRRDFTINSLYFNLSSRILEDPSGRGLDDLGNKILRFVGVPKLRIQEDPLRAFRFYRFLSKGFNPDKNSLSAVRERLQEDSKRITDLQKVLNLSGVKEIIDGSSKLNMNFDELSETIISFERVRLEIERIVL